MQAGHKKHEHCSCALEEAAPKVLGHGSISEWDVMATERRTPRATHKVNAILF